MLLFIIFSKTGSYFAVLLLI
jgi:hypothetical protein